MFEFSHYKNGGKGSPYVEKTPRMGLKVLSGYPVYKGAALTIIGNSALRYASGGTNVYAIAQTSAISSVVTASYPISFIPVDSSQVWKVGVTGGVTAVTAGDLLLGVTACIVKAPAGAGTCIMGRIGVENTGGINGQIWGFTTAGASGFYVVFKDQGNI